MSDLRPLSIDRERFAALLGVSPSMLRVMEADAALPARLPLGNRVLWSLAEVTEWVSMGCPPLTSWREIWPRYGRNSAQRPPLALRIPEDHGTSPAKPADQASASEGGGQ